MMPTLFSMRGRFPDKRIFDPKNPEDLKAYRNFLKKNNWGKNGCPFELEWPWLSIPYMISHKITEHTLKKI
jgi:hypothetical protein